MNPVEFGMIGFGRMGGFYLEQMQKSGRWEVAYICDVSAESREEARRLAPQAQVIADEQDHLRRSRGGGRRFLRVGRLPSVADRQGRRGRRAYQSRGETDRRQRGTRMAGGVASSKRRRCSPRSTCICAIRGITIRIKEFIFLRARSANWRSSAYVHMTPGLAPGEGHEYEGPAFHDCGMTLTSISHAGTPNRSSRHGMRRPCACGTTRTRGGCSVAVACEKRRGVRHHAGACLRAVVREADA